MKNISQKDVENKMDYINEMNLYAGLLGDDAVRVFYGDFIGKQEGYAADFTEELVESLLQCQKGR